MLEKMFAAMVAAMLVAGAAWAVDVIDLTAPGTGNASVLGGTTVNGGTLRLTGTTGTAGGGTGAISVRDGAILELNRVTATSLGAISIANGGTLYGYQSTVNSNITVASGGTLEIGTAVMLNSTLTAGRISINNGGVLNINVSSSRAYDKLTVNNGLMINGGTVRVTIPATFNFNVSDTLTIVQSGNVSGTPTFDLPHVPNHRWETSEFVSRGILYLKVGTGLESIKWQENISLYPMPADDVLNIALPELRSNATLTIQNPQGQVIKTSTTSLLTTQMDVSNLSSGVYLLTITTDEGSTTRRFIKR